MGKKLAKYLFLSWILTTTPQASWILAYSCEERLLLANYEVGLEDYCVKTNESRRLTVESFRKVSISPRNGGTVFALNSKKIKTFLWGNSSSSTVTPHLEIKLEGHGPRNCAIWGSDFSSSPLDMAVDWITNTAYLTYKTCGIIRVYDLNRSLYATIHEDPTAEIDFVETYPQSGLLIWTQTRSIHRAMADGTVAKVLVVVESGVISDLALDYRMSLVYWTDWDYHTLQSCDLDGNNRRQLNLSPMERPRKIAILDNIVYWQDGEWENPALFRADVEQERKQLVFSGIEFTDLEIYPSPSSGIEPFENPCENNPCSQICVQSSSRRKYSCLCVDDYVLHGDGHNCSVRTYLVISTVEGIMQVPASREDALPGQLPVSLYNTSNPSDVQYDSARRRIFWAEKGTDSARIMQADMGESEVSPKLVFQWNHSHVRQPAEELQAFALDVITENLYLVFRGHRRILACSIADLTNGTTSDAPCAELFGNQVASSVGGLALDPTEATMYWTEQDDGDNLAVVKGGMAGTWLQILRKKGLKHPTNIAFDRFTGQPYWLDSLRHHVQQSVIYGELWAIESSNFKDFVPQRISFHDRRLYWVGRPGNGSTTSIFRMDFESKTNERLWETTLTRVTGFSVYDPYRYEPIRQNHCGPDYPCAGICLLSGEDTFRCVCPIGFQPDDGPNNGSNHCRESVGPTVIYASQGRAILMMNETSISYISDVRSFGLHVALDPVGNQAFWSDSSDCEEIDGMKSRSFYGCRWTINWIHFSRNKGKPTTIVEQTFSIHPAVGEAKLTPFSLEYDWVGDNVYFLDYNLGACLCGRATETCTIVMAAKEFPCFSADIKIAVDPPNGRMYWINGTFADDCSRTGIWRGGMDMSNRGLIIMDRRVTLLTIDHSSQSIFWVERPIEFWTRDLYEIYRSDLDGQSVRLAIRLKNDPHQIRVAGNRLFWMDSASWHSGSGNTMFSCDKDTGDNLMAHELQGLDARREFVVISPASEVPSGDDPCIPGALCSHMCVSTPAGYLRCLCPTGFQLMSDGWNCECSDATICNASKHDKPLNLRPPSAVDSALKSTNQVVCRGNEFPCAGECLKLDKICNGFPDCLDFSDEGDRCNEICKDDHECSHNCFKTASGPTCFCLPEQMLAEDKKSCVLLRTKAEIGKAGLIIAGVMGGVLIIVTVLGTIKYRQTKRERDLTQGELNEFLRGDPAGASVAPDGVDRALLLPYTKTLSPEDIVMARDKVLGSGEFGIVHPGIYNSEPVAIKALKRCVDVEEFKAILGEIKIMAYLGDHDFIVKFVGTDISEISKRKVLIVTELSPKGDLLRYLWKVASVGLEAQPGVYENVSENTLGVTHLTLYKWCEQIASGMEYLAEKQIIHGDLAARNVLVFKDNKVKLSDFGLSKQLYGSTTYRMKKMRTLPWKWSSIEVIASLEFSEKSDVWAFGVTAWEIFSLGQTPYKGMSFGDEFIQFLQAGNRLAKPVLVTEQIYNILMECWDCDKSNRPNFRVLKQIFHDFLAQRGGHTEGNVTESTYITAV